MSAIGRQPPPLTRETGVRSASPSGRLPEPHFGGMALAGQVRMIRRCAQTCREQTVLRTSSIMDLLARSRDRASLAARSPRRN